MFCSGNRTPANTPKRADTACSGYAGFYAVYKHFAQHGFGPLRVLLPDLVNARPADDFCLAFGQNSPVAIAKFFPILLLARDKTLQFFERRGDGFGK